MRRISRDLFVLVTLTMLATGSSGAQEFVGAGRLGGPLDEGAQAVAVDAGGSRYTIGDFTGTADFDPGPSTYPLTSAGSYDAFVSKIDAAGRFAWARRFGGPGWEFPTGVAVDAGGNVYTVGSFTGTADFDPGPGTYNLTATGSEDAFLLKLNSQGGFLWARRLCVGASGSAATGVVVKGSSVYVVGSFEGTADLDPGAGTLLRTSAGSHDAFVSKLGPAGNLTWARVLGGGGYDKAAGVAVDAAGGVTTIGYFFGTADFDPGPGTYGLTASVAIADVFVSKLDGAGNFSHAGMLDGFDDLSVESIAADGDGSLYITGTFYTGADLDPGAGVHDVGSPYCDGYLLKLDGEGDFVWAATFGGPTFFDAAFAHGAGLDGSGGIYVVGSFMGMVDFDPGPGTYVASSVGDRDAFVSKIDDDGRMVWAVALGGTDAVSIASGVAVDASGVHTVGFFSGTVDFDPGPGAAELTSSGDYDAFLSTLSAFGRFDRSPTPASGASSSD